MMAGMNRFLFPSYRYGASPARRSLRGLPDRSGILLIGVLLLLAGSLTGCGGNGGDRNTLADDRGRSGGANEATETASVPVLRVAEQHGLAYAPLALIRTAGDTSRSDESTDTGDSTELRIEWIRVNNAAAVREAMLANRLDVGFMGIPPYLIGRDTGTGWRAFTGVSRAPLGLVTIDPGIPDLETIAAPDASYRVALPQPGSIQHILLAIALDRRFDDPTRLDHRLVSLGHPDGMSALLAAGGDISAHFTSPPFLFEELRHPTATLLLSGEDAFGGEFTFIIGVLRPELAPEAPAVVAFRNRLQAAIGDITRLQLELRDSSGVAGTELSPSSTRTLGFLADAYEIDTDALRRDLAEEGLVYEQTIRGMDRFRSRMHDFGYISADVSDGIVQ
jgi:NitT/TauT family transport system substrate-binding protein